MTTGSPMRQATALSALFAIGAAAWLAGQEPPEEDVPFGGAPECPAGESAILGRVQDAETGMALPTARVVARMDMAATPEGAEAPEGAVEPRPDDTWSTEADPAGDFALCGVSPGPVAVSAEFQGVRAPAETVHVETSARVHAQLAVPLGRPGRLEGRVLAGETPVPVERALVTLDPLGIQALTDSAGGFRVDPIPPASYALAVHHATGVRVYSLEIRPGSRVHFESRLTAREVVLGTARVGPALRGAEEAPPEEAPPEDEAPATPEHGRRGPLRAAARAVGTVLDPPLLRKWRANRLSQALTLVPGLDLVRRCVGRLSTACGILPRLASEEATCQEAAVYIDGRRVPAGPPLRVLDRLPVEDLASVHVVGPGEPLPEEVGEGEAECGAVLIWRSP